MPYISHLFPTTWGIETSGTNKAGNYSTFGIDEVTPTAASLLFQLRAEEARAEIEEGIAQKAEESQDEGHRHMAETRPENREYLEKQRPALEKERKTKRQGRADSYKSRITTLSQQREGFEKKLLDPQGDDIRHRTREKRWAYLPIMGAVFGAGRISSASEFKIKLESCKSYFLNRTVENALRLIKRSIETIQNEKDDKRLQQFPLKIF